MSDPQDLGLTAKRLEELSGTLREGNLSLEETIRKVGEAVVLYREFKKRFSAAGFDVKILLRDNGELREEPFDWKALEP